MKILIMGYVGKKNTGIGRTLIETVKALAEIDSSNEYIIYSNYDNKEIVSATFQSNVKIVTYNISRCSSIKNLIFNAIVFPFYALKLKSDLVYIPNFALILFSFRPVVSVIHDMIEFKVDKKFSRLRMMYRKNIVPRMAGKSTKIITVSNNSMKDIVELCKVDPKKIEVVYDAVADDYGDSSQIEGGIYSNYILYVGTVDYPGKNVHGVIKAYESYKKKINSNLKLVIAGMPGKDFEYIERQVNESAFKVDIDLKGYVTEKELVSLYKGAKCFLFVSFYEGFGLPVIEAMKMGVPVITSNRSSLPEVAGDAAILCNPDDVNCIADSIEKILNNENMRKDLVERGFKNIKRFSWDISARKTLEVFNSAIA